MKNASVISIRPCKKTNNDFFFIDAGGDRDFDGELNQKEICRRFEKRRQEDVDDCSSDSLRVNIGDLADAEELQKSTQICITHRQEKNSSSSNDQVSNDLIEDVHILHGFRTHSKDILTLLSQKDRTRHLSKYGEQKTGRKLLSIAAEVDWYEAVLFLLNRDVNINETDRENRTALIDCLTATDINIILALVKKPECNLDIQTLTGHTAAHYAVIMNKIPFFEILINFGARLDLCNDKGENVLHQIIEYKRKKCWKIVKHYYRHHPHGFIHLQNLIHAQTDQHQTCLTMAFEHRPKIYFFQELLPYIDPSLINIEVFQSWSKAYKLIRDLFSYKKKEAL